LLVSFTLTPMMSARLLGGEKTSATSSHAVAISRRGFYAWIERGYMWTLGLVTRHRVVVILLAFGVIASAMPLYTAVRQEYIPSEVDEAEFEVNVTAPERASVAAMDEVMRRVEADLRATPGVRLVLTAAGGGFLGNVNQGGAYVRIAPHEERTFSLTRLWQAVLHGNPLQAFQGNYTQRDVMQEVRRRLSKYPDLRTSVRNAPSFNIGGGSWEIDFVLRGPDLHLLASYAEQLRQNARALGLVDADTTLRLDKPELHVEIDRARAAALGVATEDIAVALRLMVGGEEKVSRFRDASVNDDYDVQLRLTEGERNDPETIARLYVPRQDGGLVRLDNLVQITPVRSASRIDRLDRQRMVSLRASISPGYALADRLAALRAAAAELHMPPAYTTSVSGRGRELERTFGEFLWAFLLSVIFMYMILASQFESLVHPFTILLSLPLVVPFALFSLWGTGNTLNLYSALGLLVLFGVVKKNAILQIDHMNTLRAEGIHRSEAILQGNRDRLRPILMTTLTLVAGMLPLALGSGPGAEERRAIAIVVIGGQTLSLLLTLIVTPVAYSLFDDVAATTRWRMLMEQIRAVRRYVASRVRAAFVRRPRFPATGEEKAATEINAVARAEKNRRA
jgi:HAE1 family hydrophobic/amphiphilic exporter-1